MSAPKLSSPVDPEQDHVVGPANAPITLVEYGDLSARSAAAHIQRCAGYEVNWAINCALSSGTFRVPSMPTPVTPPRLPKQLQRRATSGKCMTSCSSTRMR